MLSTHSRHVDGFPFGSVMPYAADYRGRPVFFISRMAMHTQNLQANWRASLLITEAVASEDALATARVTLLGQVEQVTPEEVSELYFERHPEARQWQEFRDFSFYRLYPQSVYFVGGFGSMGWIAGEDYAASISV